MIVLSSSAGMNELEAKNVRIERLLSASSTSEGGTARPEEPRSFVKTNDDMNRHNVVIMSSRFSTCAHPHGCPPRVIGSHRVAS